MDVYELYGSQVADFRDVRSLLSDALGVAFEDHDSYYRGEYFRASWPSDQELTIEPNQLEDEDGPFLKEPEFSEYRTLVRYDYRASYQPGDGPAPDEISSRLGSLDGLTLLEREVVAADSDQT